MGSFREKTGCRYSTLETGRPNLVRTPFWVYLRRSSVLDYSLQPFATIAAKTAWPVPPPKRPTSSTPSGAGASRGMLYHRGKRPLRCRDSGMFTPLPFPLHRLSVPRPGTENISSARVLVTSSSMHLRHFLH